MNCSAFLSAIWLALAVISSVVSLPVASNNEGGGGYPDSLQSLGYGAPSPSYGTGTGSGYGNEPANYDFQYEVFGGGNFFGHQESRRDKNTNGKYHVLLPDGRRQIVTYTADETGYHPTITYEDAGSEGGYPNSPSNEGYGAPSYGACRQQFELPKSLQ
ncbi:Pro-resilin [Orchesella cincta]|uniref:Pro-resilin n=1 Tax=Orchesella cincta TaxID=48709 RepID=A0A1D2MC61_ORCCI|nr:Pro-resilin [Orchesella cincta]